VSAAPLQGFRGYDADPIADVDEDARREAVDERRQRARMNHWCEECRGRSGGPCDQDPED
jgi:hypothetical protein